MPDHVDTHPISLQGELARQVVEHCKEQDEWSDTAAHYELLVLRAYNQLQSAPSDNLREWFTTAASCFSAATKLAKAYGNLASHERRVAVFMRECKASEPSDNRREPPTSEDLRALPTPEDQI